jgi:hypothetical protein
MTPKEEATRLHSLLIRDRGMCEAAVAHKNGLIDWHPACAGQLETSHILSRRYSHTRTALDGSLCLCASAHRHIAESHKHHVDLVTHIYGAGHWEALYERAQSTAKVDWDERVEVLSRLAEQRGLI